MYKFFQEKFPSVHLHRPISKQEFLLHFCHFNATNRYYNNKCTQSVQWHNINNISSEVIEANICWYGCPFSYLHYMYAQKSKMQYFRCNQQSSGMQHCVLWQRGTNISEEPAASIFRVDLRVAARSSKTLVPTYLPTKLHAGTSYNTVIISLRTLWINFRLHHQCQMTSF